MLYVNTLVCSMFRAEHWEMDQEGQIKHSSSGINRDFGEEDDADDNADNGDHEVYDIQANAKDGDNEVLLQAIVLMKTRTTRRLNCTLAPVPLGRFPNLLPLLTI